MDAVSFSDIHVARPEFQQVADRYDNLFEQWQQAADTRQQMQVIHAWDTFVRELESWENLTQLYYEQDTRNPERKQAREYLDALRPKLTRFNVEMKRQLLSSPDRAALEAELGPQAFALWEADVASFDPRVEDDLAEESKLEAEYTELLASAQLEFQGDTYNLSGLARFHTDAERQVRYGSNRVRWEWFASHRTELDRIYDDLVRVRHGMAEKLGFPDFVHLGYQRMKRVDYGRDDVQRFREGVQQHVVPLVQELRRRQAETLNIERVMVWDEGIFDLQGNPRPQGDHDWLIEQALKMFDQMGAGLGEFFRVMVDRDLMDLKNRAGKAGGGFCTDLTSFGIPYIFANFNGTKGDVEVFTHEVGHAFQFYCSRHLPLRDYLFPTNEACEIHSMGLEFLTWPHMEKFFANDAERFRQIHLTQSLMFLPYGVAVDHFQHLIYEHPAATPDERHDMWRSMEATYLPWRDAGDLPHISQGGQWQLQRHIYLYPFYYIDYTLALTCALQLWVQSRQDPDATMRSYLDLCSRGGAEPFQALVKSAGLTTPFQADCLRTVVAQAREVLEV